MRSMPRGLAVTKFAFTRMLKVDKNMYIVRSW
jgi:hypothetical protein